MGENYLFGLLWILIAGIGQGSFTLPMKFLRRWGWEHLWLYYSLIAFYILPLAIALWTVPELWRVYETAPANIILLTALFGLGWGAGSVFFGLGVDALGMALGFSMMTGLYTALGALIPMLILTPDLLWSESGFYIIAGNAVTIIGVAILGVAGEERERMMGAKVAPGTLNPKLPFWVGMAICIASGVLSAAFNFSYAFGKPIADVAHQLGAAEGNGLNAIWLIALPAGGLINVGYCLYLLERRKTWSLLVGKTSALDWAHAVTMSVLWTGSVIVYGWGANYLGRLGPSLGWSLWNVFLIITTVICGLMTREWEGVTGRARRLLFIGIGFLLAATLLLGMGGAGG